MSVADRPQVMDPDWLVWHQSPKTPAYVPPPGAVDAHCHVFGPAAEFPFAPERKYTPCDASKAQLFALRDHLGFSRNVIVQATCHGKDNRATVDAVKAANGLARGVATVGEEITEAELAELHEAGIRGVRFNFLRRLADFTPHEVLRRIADKVAPFDWHVVVYFEAPDLAELKPLFSSLPTKVVVDHMGRPDVRLGTDHPQWRAFVDWMTEDEDVWSKVSCPERLSLAGPPYGDVVPFQREIVETFPDRVLWGTDWPHPNLKGHMVDDGVLVDQIPRFALTEELRRKLLVDNPMRLYWAD
ncbi:amidohydrolase family protein [Phenylobacterium sp.]|uniref:amidohydrolase family protein n=1 Tax=Phenylobacterium sp. TaxID=1871053 RepID=UPI002B7FA0D7|nr:amidohydrolase family protein [Phenylobacterium sp.]HVI33932.1 amidohydrolase family protein [Phenylobacterium sp.]